MKLLYGLLLGCICCCTACSPARLVKPLDKGQWSVGANLGGPLINFAGLDLPVPFTSVYAAYGLTQRSTIYTGMHITTAAFGNLQTDIGILTGLMIPEGWKPGLSIGLGLNSINRFQTNDHRFYPAIDLHAYWIYGKRGHTVYTGMNNWIDLYAQAGANDDQYNLWLPAIHMGHIWSRGKWDLSLELKYLAPQLNNNFTVVNYIFPPNYGALGVYFGVVRKF